MKNTLTDLNNYLFETLEHLMDKSLSDEEMKREITKANAVTSVAETIIHNGELALKAMKHAEEYNIGDRSRNPESTMPPMLTAEV
jgi:hypothetical protein